MTTKVKISGAGRVVETTLEKMAEAAERIPTLFGGNAREKLRSIVDRAERLNEDKANLASDLKEVFAEAKVEGFDTKILRKVIRLRAQDAAARAEEADLIEMYMRAL